MPRKQEFHVGYYERLHDDPSINFQMNRWINYLGADALQDLQGISPNLSGFSSYRREFLALAEKAFSQGRNLHAAYYFRSAEFFMGMDDPEKMPTRNRFLGLLRDQCGIDERDRFDVPYQDGDIKGLLPAYCFTHSQAKGTILIHGGFDSYIEEFFPVVQYIREQGFTVICFEGPGQGGALLESRLLLTHEWHKPVKAVLDYFKLEQVTLLGLSMGGCLALRAAALEPRVERVVAYDVFLDWMDTTLEKLKPIAPVLRGLLKARASVVFNIVLKGIMQKSPLFDWGMHQAMLVLGASTSYEVFLKSRPFTTRDISPQVRQDVLLLAGTEDHVIPLSHFSEQVHILRNARSVTARLFTRAEHAQNHCQVGNLRLAVDFIAGWIEFTSRHAAQEGPDAAEQLADADPAG